MIDTNRSTPPGVDAADLELRDSAALIDGRGTADTGVRRATRAALLERFREDGYLLFRGRLDRTAVDEVREVVVAVLEREGVVAPDGSLRTRAPVPERGSERYLGVLRQLLALEVLHRLAYHEAIVGLARTIGGEDDVVVHPRKVIRLCHPHALDAMSTTGTHQDYTYVQGGVDGLTMWVPLTDAPRQRGALAVLVGSAAEGVRPIRGAIGPCGSGPTVPRASDAGRWGSTDFAVGDVLVLHSLTVHRGLPNLTAATRLSLDLRYRAVSQTLTLPEMWPPNHPDLGEWTELTQDWESTEWLSLPQGVRIVGARPAGNGLSVPASALVGTPATELPPL
jgi:hypothetical protein